MMRKDEAVEVQTTPKGAQSSPLAPGSDDEHLKPRGRKRSECDTPTARVRTWSVNVV